MVTRPERPRAPRPAPTPLLVVRAQLGDRDALDVLLAALQEPLASHLAALLGDRDRALDVLQEVLLTVARKLGALRDPRWVRAWAFRIATRRATRELRRVRASPQLVTDDETLASVSASDSDGPFDVELLEGVEDMVAALPPACGLVVRLRYLEELSVPEIAEALEVAEGTVKSRLAYGLARVRERAGVPR